MAVALALPVVLLRYTARDTDLGDPQRVVVAYDGEGVVVGVQDEGHDGPHLATKKLCDRLGITSGQVINLGDVDVRPGVYRRMLHYISE
jgi:hypothetical protein